jgi:hypothetical protein
MTISGTHTLEAFHVLRAVFAKAHDPWFSTVVLSAIALTRRQERPGVRIDSRADFWVQHWWSNRCLTFGKDSLNR